jgi:iron complex outermembrane receptor protein
MRMGRPWRTEARGFEVGGTNVALHVTAFAPAPAPMFFSGQTSGLPCDCAFGVDLGAIVSYVRGENLTTGDDLYQIMPINAKVSLVHRKAAWTTTLEVLGIDAKSHVSRVRNEVRTPGYGLVNLRTSYEWQKIRLDLAVENLFDRFYSLPLGGAYLGQGPSMTTNGIPWGVAVPGLGRSVNVALSAAF